MLVKFLKTGQLDTVISDDYWGQGENNVDFLQAQFYSNDEKTQYYNTSNYTIECIVKRPDGVISPALVMSSVTLDGIKSAQLSINNWITEVAGELQFTIRLKQTVGGVTTTLVTGLCYRTIGQAIDPADQTITDVQFAALEADIQALDSRLDTAEDDIDDLEAGMLKKVDFYADSSNTSEDLYTAVGSNPSIVKCGSATMLITLATYGATQYAYSAIVLENSSNVDNIAKMWARTYFANKTDTIATIVSGIKGTNYRIQSYKDLSTALGGYVQKVAGKGLSTNDLTDALKGTYDGYAALISAKADTSTVNAALALKGDKANLDAVEAKIPAAASNVNQLADKAFVNSSINAMASFQLSYNSSGDPFPSKAALEAATTFYNAGTTRTPTQNDYAVVSSDETQDNAQVRYNFQGTWGGTYSWQFGYKINDKPFTTAQNNAINSGITSSKVSQYDAYASSKLDKVSEQLKVYGTDASGNQVRLGYTSYYSPNSIMIRGSGGRTQVGIPIQVDDAATKGYVDGKTFTPVLSILSDGSYSFEI